MKSSKKEVSSAFVKSFIDSEAVEASGSDHDDGSVNQDFLSSQDFVSSQAPPAAGDAAAAADASDADFIMDTDEDEGAAKPPSGASHRAEEEDDDIGRILANIRAGASSLEPDVSPQRMASLTGAR